MNMLTRRTMLAATAAVVAALAVKARKHFTRAEILAAVERGICFRVFLNGVEIDRVLDGDPDAGWVEVGARHPCHGGYYIVDAHGREAREGDIAREKHFGIIEVEPIGWAA